MTNNIVITPGVNNPTGVEQGLEFGLEVLKFFPAEASGGVKMLKALGGPYAQVRFVPTERRVPGQSQGVPLAEERRRRGRKLGRSGGCRGSGRFREDSESYRRVGTGGAGGAQWRKIILPSSW